MTKADAIITIKCGINIFARCDFTDHAGEGAYFKVSKKTALRVIKAADKKADYQISTGPNHSVYIG